MDLRTLRKRLGLSQEAAARQANVAAMTWAHWEQGLTKPTFTSIQAIAKVLGVTTDVVINMLK